jgi:lipopolysaccharide transport system permease protein
MPTSIEVLNQLPVLPDFSGPTEGCPPPRAPHNQEGQGADQPESIIAPPRGWQPINVRELWHFRELVYFLVWRDVKVRYKQTLLGVAWTVLQPAMMMVVFTLFFGRAAGFKDDTVAYPVFVLCGLLPWTFFSSGLVGAGNSVVGSERLISKVYFPRLAMPLSAVGSALFDFILSFGLLFCVMMIYQTHPSWSVLLTPFILIPVALAAAGFGTFLAALNVAYRDVRYVIPFLVQLWIFATPAVYTPTVSASAEVGDHGGARGLDLLLSFNPLNGLVAAFRSAVLGRDIDWSAFLLSSVAVAVIFLFGSLYFRRVEDSFADSI